MEHNASLQFNNAWKYLLDITDLYMTVSSRFLIIKTLFLTKPRCCDRECEREKTVVVFITKQTIELHLNYYIHKAVSILQTGKKRTKLP
jgi:hypothetical protein